MMDLSGIRDSLEVALFRVQVKLPQFYTTGDAIGDRGEVYRHAELPELLKILKPILFDEGLVLRQEVTGESVVTHLYYLVTGESLRSEFVFPDSPGYRHLKDIGALITYVRRYALCGLFNICPEKDVDAGSSLPVKSNYELCREYFVMIKDPNLKNDYITRIQQAKENVDADKLLGVIAKEMRAHVENRNV